MFRHVFRARIQMGSGTIPSIVPGSRGQREERSREELGGSTAFPALVPDLWLSKQKALARCGESDEGKHATQRIYQICLM